VEVMDRAAQLSIPVDAEERDQVVVMHGLEWSDYESLLRARGVRRRPKMHFLDGTLELVTKSPRHEFVTKMLARFVECWAEERNRALNGLRETTFRNKRKRAGLEADECYWIGDITKYPQLAFEVVLTSGGIDKLEIYRRLGVQEVWFWIDDRISVHALTDRGYVKRDRSGVVRGIDLDDLTRRVRQTDFNKQTSAVRAYRRSLQRKRQVIRRRRR
jgi:Uma2 family endonuclease